MLFEPPIGLDAPYWPSKVVAKVEDDLGHFEGVVHVLEACSYLGRDPKGEEALLGCRTECWTLMSLHFETQLYLQSNRDMYIWNQVSCTKSYYANVEMSSPSNQWSYPKVSCPYHHIWIERLLPVMVRGYLPDQI